MTSIKKLYVHIVKKGEGKYELTALSVDKIVWFGLPDQLKDLDLHKELLEIKTIVSSKNSITKVGGYRKVAVTFKPELQNKYLDEDDNFRISDHYLEEYNVDEASAFNMALGETKTANEVFLIKRIKELEERISTTYEVTLREIEQKFLLGKFNGKQEAGNWITCFEKECIRFKIFDGSTRVEALKLFIEGNVKEWYGSCLIKLPLADWEVWKNSFLVVYGKKSWSGIRTAFDYKYMFGSLIDFALKKERLLLEADKDMPEIYRVYQIVYNLPLNVQDRLDREKIETVDDVIRELNKFNESFMIQKRSEEKQHVEKKRIDIMKKSPEKIKDINKRPCTICEGLGFKNRFHPMSVCRNKQTKNVINLTELDDIPETDFLGIEMENEKTLKN